jgi:hypothetical protein
MNTYRFVLLGADVDAPGAHIFCENQAAALELAEAMAERGGPVEVWCGAGSLGIVFSKKTWPGPIESVWSAMTKDQTLPFTEVGIRQAW